GKSVNITGRGAFDPTLLGQFSWDRTTSPLNSLVVAGAPFVTPTTTFLQFGYQQAFPTGTIISLTLANQRQSTTQQRLIYNPDVISRLSFTFVQQLMNGFGLKVNRRFQNVAGNNLELVYEWFRQRAESTLSDAQKAYWDLAAAQEK